MVHRPFGAVAAAQAQVGGRSSVRPFFRTSVSPRNQTSALAARQIAATMHHGSSRAEEGEPRQAADVTPDRLNGDGLRARAGCPFSRAAQKEPRLRGALVSFEWPRYLLLPLCSAGFSWALPLL